MIEITNSQPVVFVKIIETPGFSSQIIIRSDKLEIITSMTASLVEEFITQNLKPEDFPVRCGCEIELIGKYFELKFEFPNSEFFPNLAFSETFTDIEQIFGIKFLENPPDKLWNSF